jgi:hypothetical protein
MVSGTRRWGAGREQQPHQWLLCCQDGGEAGAEAEVCQHTGRGGSGGGCAQLIGRDSSGQRLHAVGGEAGEGAPGCRLVGRAHGQALDLLRQLPLLLLLLMMVVAVVVLVRQHFTPLSEIGFTLVCRLERQVLVLGLGVRRAIGGHAIIARGNLLRQGVPARCASAPGRPAWGSRGTIGAHCVMFPQPHLASLVLCCCNADSEMVPLELFSV